MAKDVMYDLNALIMSHRRLIDTELKMHIKTAFSYIKKYRDS